MTTVSFYFVQTALLQCLLGIHRFRIEKVNLLRVLFLFSSVFIGVCVCVYALMVAQTICCAYIVSCRIFQLTSSAHRNIHFIYVYV